MFTFIMLRAPQAGTLSPYTTLFRSLQAGDFAGAQAAATESKKWSKLALIIGAVSWVLDRKSTRLNSSHLVISYAVFCLKKKKIWDFPDSVVADSLGGQKIFGYCKQE